MEDEDYSGVTVLQDDVLDFIPDPTLVSYLSYLSLGFKLIATLTITLLAGWIAATIRNTRRLCNPHNIFVANLMITDIALAILTAVQSSVLMLEDKMGLDLIGCNVFQFLLFPAVEIYFMFLVISVDKTIAILYPYNYRKIMTSQVVKLTIAVTWFLSLTLFVRKLFNPAGYKKVPEFGACPSVGSAFLETLLTHILPTFITSLITITMDIFLSVKAYRVGKQIEEESKLSGATTQLKALKIKQAAIKRNLKPMITLLVVITGSTLVGMLFPLMYIPVGIVEDATSYKYFVDSTLAPNVGYIVLLVQPFVYGIYFKQIRQPLMRSMKGKLCTCKCKSAAVAPQGMK